MKTLLIAASLFTTQPIPASTDTQWVDLQSIQEQLRSYLIEDKRAVSSFIQATLHDSLRNSNSLFANFLLPAEDATGAQKLAATHPKHNQFKDTKTNNSAVQ